jgi:hypothetical protein
MRIIVTLDSRQLKQPYLLKHRNNTIEISLALKVGKINSMHGTKWLLQLGIDIYVNEQLLLAQKIWSSISSSRGSEA